MKHNSELRTFLESFINIDKRRLENAKGKVSSAEWSLITYLENNLGETFESIYQWSFAYHTIIKPDPNSDAWKYDVDVAIKLNYKEEWDGEEHNYHGLILDCLKASGRYKDKIDESKERAIRVQYDSNDGEFYVDVVPMFHDWENWNVIDRKSNIVEISWWTEFRDWVNEQNNKTSIEGSTKKFLKEVIRIYKFLRNTSDPDLIRSVQLTLLLSRQIDKLSEDDFSDLTSTLYWVTVGLKNELESTNSVNELDLSNPWLPSEIFDRKFTEEQFQEFKQWIIELAEKIEDAFIETDETESLTKWREVFWEKFGDYTEISKSNYLLANYSHAENPSKYNWSRSGKVDKIQIIWTKPGRYHKAFPIPFRSNEGILPNQTLRFYAKLPENLGENRLFWQVTNENNTYVVNKRWEIKNESLSLGYVKKYRGYGIQETWVWKGGHWVKCYLINEYNQLIWESDKFCVNIL